MADEGQRVSLAHSPMDLRPWSSAKADKKTPLIIGKDGTIEKDCVHPDPKLIIARIPSR